MRHLIRHYARTSDSFYNFRNSCNISSVFSSLQSRFLTSVFPTSRRLEDIRSRRFLSNSPTNNKPVDHLPTRSFLTLFTSSFAHSLICSSAHSLRNLRIQKLSHSFTHLITHSVTDLITHSLTYSHTRSLTHLITHSLTQSLS